MANEMNRPTLPLLPDLEGEATLAEGLGLRPADGDFLAVLAQTMDAPGEAYSADVLGSMRQRGRKIASRQGEAAWRGLLATVLLWDTWAEKEALLNVSKVEASTPFAAMVLSARRKMDQTKPLQLVTLSHGSRSVALGLVHETLGLVPAAAPADLSDMLPARVTWYDRTAGVFADPTDRLNERDRATLIHRLNLLESDAAKRFASILLQEGLQHSRAIAAQEENALADLSVRALAVCGLQGMDGLSSRKEMYTENAADNPLLRVLDLPLPAVRDSFQQQTTWLWQGRPFARSSSVTGFEPVYCGEEAKTLAAVAAECAMLTASVAWQQKAAAQLREWLERCGQGRGFSPAAREQLKEVLHQTEAAGRRQQEPVTLQWPWSQASGAAAWLIRELLGEALEDGVSPFSDKIALLPNAAEDALGDPALCMSCALPMEATGMPTLALPPLSAALARAVAEKPDCLRAESFSMAVTELGAVQATFTVQGKRGEVTFTRLYDEEDIVLLQPEDTPTVAVWPSVAFPADQWKAYHVYTHGHGVSVSVLQDGAWVCDDAHLWSVVRTEQFPVCLTVHQNGVCLGALLNQLPVFQPERKESTTAAIDLGMSGTAVALMQDGKAYAMQLPCLVRTLLHGLHPAPFDKEFLPAEAINGVLPSCAAIFRDAAEPLPLVDGHTGGAEQLEYVRTSLKWGVEGPDRKACLLHLRQTMLTASLCAKMNGARDIAWRVVLPADLSPARRASLLETVRMLAPEVARESCMPLAVTQTPVRCVDGDQAAATYLKAAGYQRGGFLSMDVGSSGASLMLWLRGMSRPCAVTHLPLGIHGMLLHTLLQQPDTLETDFADMKDEAAQQAIASLTAQLRAARGSRKALGRCMYLLDEMIARHGHTLQQSMDWTMAQGGMTLMQALLLCGFAWLMTTAGLQLERAWRDNTVNDHLPQEIPLCLMGRGSLLLDAMPDTLKHRLTRFIQLGMSRDHAVRQVYATPPRQPKYEVVLGAVQTMDGVADLAADAPAQADLPLPIVPLPLLQTFLGTFAAEFPAAAQRLWPDQMQEGQLTPEAAICLQSLVQMHPDASSASLALCIEEFENKNMK